MVFTGNAFCQVGVTKHRIWLLNTLERETRCDADTRTRRPAIDIATLENMVLQKVIRMTGQWIRCQVRPICWERPRLVRRALRMVFVRNKVKSVPLLQQVLAPDIDPHPPAAQKDLLPFSTKRERHDRRWIEAVLAHWWARAGIRLPAVVRSSENDLTD